MLLLDVNLLVYAHRTELPQHPAVAEFVKALLTDERAFGVPQIALSSFVRIVTQRAFHPPSPTSEALDFCAAMTSAPNCIIVQPGERHWAIFDQLCRVTNATGKLVPDAYLAAFAIDRDDEWVTADRDFGKFPGLTWRLLPENRRRTNPR
ncbi:MAG TPA: type II toxin-antitoxin system VapC family toxin [Tepidisphaeraceae bacterium]|nr:type II toxin-antitoxin system VapC family toxin [Tepidisphaeraceae bacterium]